VKARQQAAGPQALSPARKASDNNKRSFRVVLQISYRVVYRVAVAVAVAIVLYRYFEGGWGRKVAEAKRRNA
jgi:hypothetical protein